MNIRRLIVIWGLFLAAATSAYANEDTLAWQQPGFTMEEVVVSMPAAIPAAQLAWQQPGYVMEEVVATITAEEIAQIRARAISRFRLTSRIRSRYF